MTILYEVHGNLYVNLTNKCPCACTFCLRQTRDHMEESDSLWLEHDVTEEELFCQARENTQKILPAKFVEIGELLKECGYETEKETRMYVLTNAENYFGASAMIFDSILSKIGEFLKDDFWILPSSIHECIIVPLDCAMGAENMRELVWEVNQTEVAPQDYLSDDIYYYQCILHRLTCVEMYDETEGSES